MSLIVPPADEGIWRATVVLASGSAATAQRVEYKYVHVSEIGAANAKAGATAHNAPAPIWESTPNRAVDLAADTFEAVFIDKWQEHGASRVEQTARSTAAPAGRLYHVRGTSVVNTRAVEVEAVARSLNSGDAFLLQTPTAMYVWCGKGCNEYERKYSTMLAKLLHLRGGQTTAPPALVYVAFSFTHPCCAHVRFEH